MKTPTIHKVERGLMDDDFIRNRETLKVYFSEDERDWLAYKIYLGGHIVWFRERQKEGYEEQEIDPALAAEIRHRLVMQELGL